MQHSSYNWYSTNSYKRYQRSNPSPRLEQFSDEGRVPLGSTTDPESIEMRKKLLETTSEETLQVWEDYRKEMREKSLLVQRQMGIKVPEPDESLRSFPVKKHNYETEEPSDHSQQRYEMFDRSKYVLNRKLNPLPLVASAPTLRPSSTAPTSESDEIYINDREPSTSNARLVVSGDEDNSHAKSQNMRITASLGNSPQLNQRPLAPKPPQPTVLKTPTIRLNSSSSSTQSTPPEPLVRECFLYSKGHCPSHQLCSYAHDGVVSKKENKSTFVMPIWHRKTPIIPLCPGYAKLTCWDMSCKLRHTMYPTDKV